MDGGHDQFMHASALQICEVAVGKLLGKPVGTAGFVIAGAGIVDYIVGPQGQFQAERVCGEMAIVV